MGKPLWNRGASIPVWSLKPNELAEAIHEWAEGCEEMEELLWACYNNGLATSYSDVHEKSNEFGFYVDEQSFEVAKRVLAASEEFGFAGMMVMYQGNPYSGPDWYKPTINVTCFKHEEVRSYLKALTRAVKDEQFAKSNSAFAAVADLAKFFQDKFTGLGLRAHVENYSDYELFVECLLNQRNWAYFDELFCSLGMNMIFRSEGAMTWSIKASSREVFCAALKKLEEGIRTKWALPVPTEPTDDMNWEAAAIMRQKFGTTEEGTQLFKDWLYTRYGRRVNY